jgi:hypothetical protein
LLEALDPLVPQVLKVILVFKEQQVLQVHLVKV